MGGRPVLAGVFPASALTATIPVLVVFAGLAQFIAGLFAYRRASVLAATAFCSFGSFNVLTGALLAMQARGIVPTSGDPLVLQGFILISLFRILPARPPTAPISSKRLAAGSWSAQPSSPITPGRRWW